MPTKRRPINRSRQRITPEAVARWRAVGAGAIGGDCILDWTRGVDCLSRHGRGEGRARRGSRGLAVATKRIPKNRAVKARITPEIVALWQTFCATSGQEQFNAQMALNVRLGRRPWDVFVQHADGPEPPSGTDESQAESWREAWQLRRALDEAVGN